ncbi:BACON domain-containing protein [Phocaeicola sp.]
MKHFYVCLTLQIVCVGLGFLSCDDSKDEQIHEEVQSAVFKEVANLNLSFEAQNIVLNVMANCKWVVSTTKSWCHIDSVTTSKVYLSVEEAGDDDRECRVVVSTQNRSVADTIYFYQQHKYCLKVSKDTIVVSAKENVFTIPFSSTDIPKISTLCDWINLEYSRVLVEHEATFHCDVNSKEEERIGNITFSYEDGEKVCVVKQKPAILLRNYEIVSMTDIQMYTTDTAYIEIKKYPENGTDAQFSFKSTNSNVCVNESGYIYILDVEKDSEAIIFVSHDRVLPSHGKTVRVKSFNKEKPFSFFLGSNYLYGESAILSINRPYYDIEIGKSDGYIDKGNGCLQFTKNVELGPSLIVGVRDKVSGISLSRRVDLQKAKYEVGTEWFSIGSSECLMSFAVFVEAYDDIKDISVRLTDDSNVVMEHWFLNANMENTGWRDGRRSVKLISKNFDLAEKYGFSAIADREREVLFKWKFFISIVMNNGDLITDVVPLNTLSQVR